MILVPNYRETSLIKSLRNQLTKQPSQRKRSTILVNFPCLLNNIGQLNQLQISSHTSHNVCSRSNAIEGVHSFYKSNNSTVEITKQTTWQPSYFTYLDVGIILATKQSEQCHGTWHPDGCETSPNMKMALLALTQIIDLYPLAKTVQ